MDERLAVFLRPDRQGDAGKIVALDNAQNFKFEPSVCALGAGFIKENRHGDGEAVGAIAPCVFTRHAVEPAFPATGN